VIDIIDEDAVRTVVFNQPDRHNAMNTTMRDDLERAITSVTENESIRLILLRGAGPSFSSGHDTGGPAKNRDEADAESATVLAADVRICEAMWTCPLPIVAQVHGFCLGVATVICNYCDLVYVSDDAQIGWPILTLGGGLIGPTWAMHVGPRKAKELEFFAGSRIDGRTAVELGWANAAFAPQQLATAVADRVAALLRVPRDLLEVKKRSVNQVAEELGALRVLTHGITWEAAAHATAGVAMMRDLIAEHGRKAVAAWQQNGTSLVAAQ